MDRKPQEPRPRNILVNALTVIVLAALSALMLRLLSATGILGETR